MAYNQPQHGGAADAYYQEGQQDVGTQQRGQYQQQPYDYAAAQGGSFHSPPPQQPQYQQQAPPPQQYQQQGPPPQQYPQQPPHYGKQPDTGNGEKMGFDQTFTIDRPKYNDVWAAVLFILTFCGFIAVSVLSIRGYATTNQGSGIYNGGSANSVALNSNTIILLSVFARRTGDGG
jgi:hypothetical protein